MSTTIRTRGIGEINSDNCWGFVLRPFTLPPEGTGDRYDRFGSGVKLMACRTNDVREFLHIATFFNEDYDKAVDALTSLLRAVKRGNTVWDVHDHLPERYRQ